MILTLRAGQAGRLIVKRAEGTPASAAPIGAVEVQQVGPVAMETDAETGDLLAHPMPPGMHLFEIRLAGRTIATGHFEVLPSPLDGVLGEQSWEIQAAEAPELAVFNISWPQVGSGVSAIVDSDYDPTSANAQAGTAVAQAVEGLLNADGVEEMLTTGAATSVSTPEGTADKLWYWCQIAAAHIPNKELKSISLRCADDVSSATGEDIRISIFEMNDEGSYTGLACSLNTCRHVAGQDMIFRFAAGVRLSGRSIRLCAGGLEDGSPVWSINHLFATRAAACSDGDFLQHTYRSGFLPQMTFALRGESRFASLGEFKEHTENAGAHVTAAEKNILSAFSWNTTYGLSFVHRTDGTVDNLLRVMLSATGTTIMTAGTLAVQAAQIARNTRTAYSTYTDTTTGTTYNFGGHTLSDIDMAPYGIATPCVWAGDATLPLLLRGSELRINGTAINVDALVSLLSQSEALLALVAGQAS